MQLIPKVFHRIWVGPDPPPPTAEEYAASWRDRHPGWDMELWTDQNMPQGQLNRDIYRYTDNQAQRADILAHEVLNQFGGVYIDIDFECLKNIEPLLEDVSYFYGEELAARPALGIFGCIAGHPFSHHCRVSIREGWPWRLGNILDETGPNFYRRALQSYLGDHAQVPQIDQISKRPSGLKLAPETGFPLHEFQPWVLYPYYLGESWTPEDHPDAYAVHHWQKNWEF